MSFAETKAYTDSFRRAAVQVKGRNKSEKENCRDICGVHETGSPTQCMWHPGTYSRSPELSAQSLPCLGVREVPKDGGRQCTRACQQHLVKDATPAGKGQRALQNTSKGRNLSKELRDKICQIESMSERTLDGRTLLPKPGAGICLAQVSLLPGQTMVCVP